MSIKSSLKGFKNADKLEKFFNELYSCPDLTKYHCDEIINRAMALACNGCGKGKNCTEEEPYHKICNYSDCTATNHCKICIDRNQCEECALCGCKYCSPYNEYENDSIKIIHDELFTILLRRKIQLGS